MALGPAPGFFRAGGALKPGNLTCAPRSTRGFLFAPEALNEEILWLPIRSKLTAR